ncbi:MAG: hypothetical protein U5L03_09350 [Burkholderiaceae bacterium]|nr:hypothetical protein [Burkholderiaceae bacterium]
MRADELPALLAFSACVKRRVPRQSAAQFRAHTGIFERAELAHPERTVSSAETSVADPLLAFAEAVSPTSVRARTEQGANGSN